ncbi:MAG: NAD+ synthase [Candidatus Zixiibacteriota bacterium]
MKLLLAQLNPVVGDITGNIELITTTAAKWQGKTDLVVFSELFLAGYPPRDLLAEPWFVDKVQAGVARLIDRSRTFPDTGILFGAPIPNATGAGHGLHNSALLVQNGHLLFTQHKSLLPTYDVFDEDRYFDPARSISVTTFKDIRLGISVCEDAWNDLELWHRRMYPFDPITELARQGAQLLVNISASPFFLGKEAIRYRLIQNHARNHGLPFLFVNQVGGNDDLIFDGRSMVFDGRGEPIAILPSFHCQESLIDTNAVGSPANFHEQTRMQSLYDALVLGTGDYMRKCGFKKAVIGLSGGIDSAIVACVAVSAIGKENVLGVAMPSMYSASISTNLARKLAENLGIEFRVIPITDLYNSYLKQLKPELNRAPGSEGTTFENLQARIRGNILMSFSNQFGSMVLSTGNKSEFATGYCTLYGDMAGGLAIISDVPKTMIYELARYINREKEIIPDGIITRPPTAELKPNQTDQDTLPEYAVLDAILHEYIEQHRSSEQIVAKGFDRATVDWVIKTVNRNEYKRRQAAPGLKVTTRAFGVGRRMPLAAKPDP